MPRDKVGQIDRSLLRWEAREVMRDLRQRPHLVTRLKLSGAHFPQRSLAPFVKVGSALTVWVEIAEDESSVRAYFAEPLPQAGVVSFGYGNEVEIRFPRRFGRDSIQRLDRARLPENTILPIDT